MPNPGLSLENLASAVLDAMPFAVAVLDERLAIVAVNGSAEQVFGRNGLEIVGLRPGDAFHCLSALATQKGCGNGPDCGECVLRRSAGRALEGHGIEQQEMKIRVRTPQGTEEERVALLTAAPLDHLGQRLAVILLQDVTVLHRLRGLVPICAGCKKVRRDDDSWEPIEAFIQEHSHAFFSHGLCSDCLERLYPEFAGGRDEHPPTGGA